LIGASPKEIIFTSGATESNNLSIKGAAHFYGKLKGSSSGSDTANAASSGVKRHIVTTQTEHKCVLDSCRSLEQEGYDVTYLPVEKATGLIDMELLERSLREDTLLVSIMAVNNEIGTRQPLEDIGKMCRKKKILFHTDGEHMRLLYYYFPIVL
jgi:cysteine desulfurase